MEIQEKPEEILKLLVEFQKMETRVSLLEEEIQQIPKEISRHEKELQEYALQLEQAKQSTEDAEKHRRALEGEVESLRQKISTYKSQLMSVKTNEEYQAMLHEISYVEKQVSAKEDAILEHMLDSDRLAEEVREVGKAYAEKEKAFSAQKKELEGQAVEDTEELKNLENKRTELEGSLPAEYLARYHRVASARNGLAVAPLAGQNCSACHVRLRPQLIAEVKKGKTIIQCENCSRILIPS